MARATLKLKRPITQLELDLDENSLETVGFIRIPETKTNADRIRAMTDEELAWELCRICRMPFYKDDSEIDGYEVDCWAKWLKQEVKE